MAQFALCITQNCTSENYCSRKTADITVDQAKMARVDCGHAFIKFGYDSCYSFIPNEKYKTFEILSTQPKGNFVPW